MGWHKGIRLPSDDDTELGEVMARYLQLPSRHLALLHANFLTLPSLERRALLDGLAGDARTVTDHDLEVLLSSEWRSKLVASYLIALSGRRHFRDRLGAKLVASELPYAAEGYCIALVSFDDEVASEWLVRYLRIWLAQPDRRYDQAWVMASLIYTDRRLGVSRANEFLGVGGPWGSWQLQSGQPQHELTVVEAVMAAISGA